MGLFIREDPGYQEDVRQTGLNRYKQLLSIRSGQWWKTGMMTLAGLVPLATGIVYSICVSSMLVLSGLYWTQLVLFGQSPTVRLRNCLLFCIKHFGRVMGTALLRLAYLCVLVLFTPWDLLLLPITGLWYITFLSQFLVYDQLEQDFHLEELLGRNAD
jgi:hypothetical protein